MKAKVASRQDNMMESSDNTKQKVSIKRGIRNSHRKTSTDVQLERVSGLTGTCVGCYLAGLELRQRRVRIRSTVHSKI